MKKISAILLALVMMLSMTAMAATITVTPPTVPDGATETGITYKAYKVFDAVISGNNVAYTIDSTNQFYDVISKSPYFKLEQLNGTSTYIVTPTDSYKDEAAAKDLAAQLKKVAATPNYTFTNEDNTVTVVEGYYLITSTVGDALILDTTQTDAFTTKNSYPSLEKTANVTTANLGDTVTYTIVVTIPENASGEIVVHDKMTGLKYTGMTEQIGVTANITCDDGCAVEFTIDAATVEANTQITIVYTAVVTADTANNEAYLVDGSYTTDTTPTPVVVKNYKFDVFKYTLNGDAEVGLAGAGFVLMNADEKYYKYTPATETTYAKVEWVDSIDDATEYVTSGDNNYTVVFEGLANGTYTLVEKTVPAGYNAAQNQKVTIADANQTGTVKVLNTSGTELPSTGGMGTTIFYVVGGLMMAAAVVLLVSKKIVASK